MTSTPRYRVENGESCIDVDVPGADRLFDLRDPAPFRERDLDGALVEYLRGASEDLLSRPKLRVVFWLRTPSEAREIETAYRAHFEYELERARRQRRRHVRAGLVALALATAIAVVLLSAAGLVQDAIGGGLGAALREGLVVSCWVLLWRPIDTLLYDGIPFRREQRVLGRLRHAPLDVRSGPGPSSAHGGAA